MVRGILQQVLHHPTEYTAEMAMRQVALHMIKHPNHFYQYIEEDLLKAGESYESYCVNWGGLSAWKVSAQGSVCLGGLPRGVSAQGVFAKGVSACVCLPGGIWQTPPCGQNDRHM